MNLASTILTGKEWPDKFFAEFGAVPIVHYYRPGYTGVVKYFEFQGRMIRSDKPCEDDAAMQSLFFDALSRRAS